MNKEDNNSRVEHKEHKDSLRPLRLSTANDSLPISTDGDCMCSPRQSALDRADDNGRVEHKDHKDSLRSLRLSTANNALPPSTDGNYMCSPRQNAEDRADDNGRVEHKDHKELLDEVRQIAYGLHLYLGIGLLEKVYENGLKHRLELAGHKVEAQKPLKVYDRDGFELGEYFVDLYVDNCLIIELKATKTITAEHLAQTLNYLSIMKHKVALLINFGSFKFECRSVVNGCVGNSRVEHKDHKDSLRSLRPSTANNALPIVFLRPDLKCDFPEGARRH